MRLHAFCAWTHSKTGANIVLFLLLSKRFAFFCCILFLFFWFRTILAHLFIASRPKMIDTTASLPFNRVSPSCSIYWLCNSIRARVYIIKYTLLRLMVGECRWYHLATVFASYTICICVIYSLYLRCIQSVFAANTNDIRARVYGTLSLREVL